SALGRSDLRTPQRVRAGLVSIGTQPRILSRHAVIASRVRPSMRSSLTSMLPFPRWQALDIGDADDLILKRVFLRSSSPLTRNSSLARIGSLALTLDDGSSSVAPDAAVRLDPIRVQVEYPCTSKRVKTYLFVPWNFRSGRARLGQACSGCSDPSAV